MNYEILTTEDFERQFKRLAKKYVSLLYDYEKFLEELANNPKMGIDLGGNTRKAGKRFVDLKL